ncbi:hypothetical protein KEJ45_01750 [Candidatus Bathyarchaeota archaeon]|nr:hypothetical protein [Candidatus Bathyarchaeota archaeon]
MKASTSLKKKVAREAAALLYFGIEKEYKQAKTRAAKTLGVNFLPSNLEVAVEFDKLAEENEGSGRQERLVQMRKKALEMMKLLAEYNPKLVGSVWRGTIHRESDTDITLYCNDPQEVLEKLRQNKLRVIESEWVAVTKKGKRKKAFRIIVELPSNEKIELTVRETEEASIKERCEIYGDTISGLSIQDLEKLLSENPTKRFIPI